MNTDAHYLVDLDGTLAYYDGWHGVGHIGDPVPAMVQKVKTLLTNGYMVKIFTARATEPEEIPYVKAWCLKHLGVELEVINYKTYGTIKIFDDRAITIEENTGQALHEEGCLISVKEYKRLLERDKALSKLEAMGVDNWDGYSE